MVSSTKTTKTIYSSSESETEEPLPPDSVCCCPSSSSGVESMYSGETETGTSTPPTRTRSSGTNTPTTQEPTKLENDCFEEAENSEEIVDDDQAGSSSAANSATSSTPNSPLTFDRRIVRMSRATRNAVLRLSISRRFCDEEEKDEEEDEGKYEEENSGKNIVVTKIGGGKGGIKNFFRETGGLKKNFSLIFKNFSFNF